MGREHIRILRRTAERGTGPECQQGSISPAESAALLLRRSIALGHRRLAIRRLVLAVRAGAEISASQWQYCVEVVERTGDPALGGLLLQCRPCTQLARAR